MRSTHSGCAASYLRLLGVCLGLASLPAHAVELSAPRLIADFVPGVSTVPFQWEPYAGAAAGERVLFTVYLAGGIGEELWSSDGTAQGSERILPVDGGVVDFAWEQGDEAGLLVEQVDSSALLRTDGTAAGTVTVATWPGTSMIGWWGRSDGRTWVAPCYYTGDYEADRCELWKVDDGTSTAERLAADLPLEYLCCSDMEQLTADGRLFFFTIENGDTRLWRSDGTAATTTALAQFPPESFVSWLGRSGRRVLFEVDLDGGGSQVWISDGTTEGTREMMPVPSYPWPATWDWYYRRQGPFFFSADDPATHTTVLWAVGGAGKARRLGAFAEIHGDLQPLDAGPTTRYVFAAARHSPAPGEQPRLRLWITDGTPAGTMELRGIPGEPLRVESVWGVTAGRVYFTASDGRSGVEPWTTDGTGAGTHQVADLCPGPCSSRLHGIAAAGTAVLFIAESNGEQMLWRSDGANPSPVVPLSGGPAFFSWAGDPFAPVASAHALLTVGANNSFALWATDGTAAGTAPLISGSTAALGSDPAPLAVSAQTLLFAAVDPLDTERRRLYLQRRGEALPGGVRLPEYVRPTAGVIDDARGLALFLVGGDYGSNLWATDGTAAGTVQLTAFDYRGLSTPDAVAGDKYHDDCESFVELPLRFGDHWVFVSFSCSSGVEVWSTDGSLAGTHRTGLVPDDASAAALVGDGVFYVAPAESDDGAEEPQLFRRPLAGGDPVQLTRRAGGLTPFAAHWAAPAQGRLFFNLGYGEGSELWVSDGTVAGTGTITTPDGTALTNSTVAVGPGFALAATAPFEGHESRLFAIATAARAATRLDGVRTFDLSGSAASSAGVFFSAWDAEHGREPWITDGTPAGTRVLDLAPGAASSEAHAFAASDAGVFFAARGLETGEELWIADAAGSGARPVADLAPGWASSSPSHLVAGPGGLLFAADDGTSGREPWLLEWTPAGAAASADWSAR